MCQSLDHFKLFPPIRALPIINSSCTSTYRPAGPPRSPFLHIGPLALGLCGLGLVLLQCKSGSHSPLPPDATTTNVEQTSSGTTEKTTSSTSGGDSATTEFSGTTSSGATSGGQAGDGDGDETRPCPSIWYTCPPMDTALEPLHERINGDNKLLLAFGAFWTQGLMLVQQSDGSAAIRYNGALRIPIERGSTPMRLEGNVTTGMFIEHAGSVFHADAANGKYLAVFAPNGDLEQMVEIAQGDPEITMLVGLSAQDDVVALATPNCRSVFFVNILDWTVKRLDIDAKYAGGTTKTTFYNDALYCAGNAYIFKIDPEGPSLIAEWRNPELEQGVQDTSYSTIWPTPEGLLTWRQSRRSDENSRFQLIDKDSLAFTEYFDPTVESPLNASMIGLGSYDLEHNTIYFIGYAGANPTNGTSPRTFALNDKKMEDLVPTQRPWSGAWSAITDVVMDDDYYYWIEDWNPGGIASLDNAQFIVRYPRNP